MNWMFRLEQKYGRYAIRDLHKYFIFTYFIGAVLGELGGGALLNMLSFSMPDILRGQVWRLVTWVFCGADGSFFGLLFMLCLIPMGRSLEYFLGSFRMNVYLFGGVLMNIVGGVLVSLLGFLMPEVGAPLPVFLSMYYILLSTFMALAICIPDATVNLYFILPIKMKWMLLVYLLELLYELWRYYKMGAVMEMPLLFLIVAGSQIIFALLNLFLFFYFARIRLSGKQKKRQRQFQKQMREPRMNADGTRHKCAICGRTERDDPSLIFRYCSKCTGNKEYCQEHLFTHTHN